MYNEDDAVAKLGGYVISVAGAGRMIGMKTLVRIEKVARSAASARLVDGADVIDVVAQTNGAGQAEPENNGGDSRSRGRGRRGGRGRRRKPAEAESKGE